MAPWERALGLRWVKQGDWAGSQLLRGHVFLGLQREVPAWTGVAEGTEAFLQAGLATWLVDGAFERFGDAYLALVRDDPRRLLALAARFEALMEEVRDLERDLARGAPDEADALARAADRYAELEMASQPYSYVFGYGEDAIVGRLVADLAGSEDAARELLTAPPDVPTDTHAAQQDVLELAALAARTGLRPGPARLQHRSLRAALDAHVARFGYLVGDADAVLASVRPHAGSAAEDHAQRRRDAEAREAAWASRVAAMLLGADVEALVLGLRRQVGVRTQRRELWMRARAAYEPWLRGMADALRIAPSDVHLLTHEELADALRGDALPDVRARRRGAALLALGGELHVLTGRDAALLLDHAQGKAREAAPMQEIRGTGASPGLARGQARILRDARDAGKVGKGDILVTDMTQPDLVLACERAAAIVTDLGGMLCHAAIVSRELGIPCVLGTQTATRALRDGDLVEVDGQAGVVRILARAGVQAGSNQL
ncbi:MAG TPA: PEP-utilizing enzyme [Candidatus Thermoplasmatota archaeon]|jgi:phosphohistidine swiveling domain-containing protein|nr:PEP-utilizing enzyme [Candidatus Thermoplasmatota archaeon]